MKTNDKYQWKNVRLLPALHNRFEFTQEVRRQFEEFQPRQVAVEYPAALRAKIFQAATRLPLLSVVYYPEADGTLMYLPIEPTDAQVEAVRLALEKKIPVHFIDRDIEGYPLDPTPMPDSYAVKRIGHFLFCQAVLRALRDRPSPVQDRLRERHMAYHLQRLARSGERVLFVGGLAHLPGLLELLNQPQAEVIGRKTRPGVELAHLHPDSSREILGEIPFVAAAYERARSEGTWESLDRLRLHQDLLERAREAHRKANQEELSRHQVRVFHRFSRNHALLSGRLVPDFYHLVVAARAAADDNFAYELWALGSTYPWQADNPGLPVLRLRGEDLFLDQRRIRFHRRLKGMRRRLVPLPGRKRRPEKTPGQWRREFGRFAICSYPPEDVVVEGYGRHLQQKAMQIKAEENTRIEPFLASMLDGLDIRETIRHWNRGLIYVREALPLKGKVGSVVVIFDPDLPDRRGRERFPWCVTWLGEHAQESDMAFYSTPAGEVMIGPGISRCQYGGFMLTYPPMRVFDIWKDPYFDKARNKPERLLLAALDYALERHVVYVAASRPSGWCLSQAARLGKKVIYVPIGAFSPVTLKRIRQFHVLDGHHVRHYARLFI